MITEAETQFTNSNPLDIFLGLVAERMPENILEVGTRRSVISQPTHHLHYFPNTKREKYIMVDIDDGVDVDVVADLHKLPETWGQSFDAFYCQAVFEHLERPWIAVAEIERILKSGGICYVGTHQTYPLHGFPSDFFRFSKEALRLLFEDVGMKVIHCDYKHRAQIVPPPDLLPPDMLDPWNAGQPSWIWVELVAVKT